MDRVCTRVYDESPLYSTNFIAYVLLNKVLDDYLSVSVCASLVQKQRVLEASLADLHCSYFVYMHIGIART